MSSKAIFVKNQREIMMAIEDSIIRKKRSDSPTWKKKPKETKISSMK